MNLTFNPHTIILLVGPEQAGKTHFAKEVLTKQLAKHDNIAVGYLSSDALRVSLEGTHNGSRTSNHRLIANSKESFDLLFHQLKVLTSHPISNEFVVVDTKGLSEPFRNQVLAIARENHYHVSVVAFDYKDRTLYGPQNVAEDAENVPYLEGRDLTKQLNRLRKDTMKTLSKRKYDKIYTVKDRAFETSPETVTVSIDNLEFYQSHFLPQENTYRVIGDTHGCLTELKQLLTEQYGVTIEGNKIVATDSPNDRFVLVGDYLDKGEETEAIIRFIHANLDYIYLVVGNHEDYNYQVLTGAKPMSKVDDRKKYYFNSLPILLENEELKEMFFELYAKGRAFYRFEHPYKNSFYVTHAPCRTRYLGKIDDISRDRQINLSIDYEETENETGAASLERQLGFLMDVKEFNYPYHVFGHVAVANVYQVGTAVGIDTGLVFGGKLTGVDFEGYKPFYKKVAKQGEYKFLNYGGIAYGLETIFARTAKDFNLQELTRKERGRLVYSAKNKVNYVAGTISPSNKNVETNELESLEEGFNYFLEKGVKTLVQQPKYMGSRCQMYLTRDAETSYGVSRGGYVIKDERLAPIIATLQERFGAYMREHDLGLLVLDGELMPWSALGEGLIDKQFVAYEKLVEHETDTLASYGFDEMFTDLRENLDNNGLTQDISRLSKKEFIKEYGTHKHQLVTALSTYEHVTSEENASGLGVFKEQLANFGQNGTPYYLPFNVLKAENTNGDVVDLGLNTEECFKFVSDDQYVVVDLESEESRANALAHFEELTKVQGMEGVVLKPLNLVDGLVPYMKVRSPRYLTLVYGHDYMSPLKYTRLFAQKDIRRKLRLSKAEANYGAKLLQIPQKAIAMENKGFVRLIGNLILDLRDAEQIDPRL